MTVKKKKKKMRIKLKIKMKIILFQEKEKNGQEIANLSQLLKLNRFQKAYNLNFKILQRDQIL